MWFQIHLWLPCNGMLFNFALQEGKMNCSRAVQVAQENLPEYIHIQPIKLPPSEMGRISAKEGVRNSIAGDQNTPECLAQK